MISVEGFKKWIRGYHLVCVIVSLVGFFIGYAVNNIWLMMWGAFFAGYSGYYYDKLRED